MEHKKKDINNEAQCKKLFQQNFKVILVRIISIHDPHCCQLSKESNFGYRTRLVHGQTNTGSVHGSTNMGPVYSGMHHGTDTICCDRERGGGRRRGKKKEKGRKEGRGGGRRGGGKGGEDIPEMRAVGGEWQAAAT